MQLKEINEGFELDMPLQVPLLSEVRPDCVNLEANNAFMLINVNYKPL